MELAINFSKFITILIGFALLLVAFGLANNGKWNKATFALVMVSIIWSI